MAGRCCDGGMARERPPWQGRSSNSSGTLAARAAPRSDVKGAGLQEGWGVRLTLLARLAASKLRRTTNALTIASRVQLRRIGPVRSLVQRARAKQVRNRSAFAELVRAAPGNARILEIGPFAWPLLRGQDIAYADVLTTEQIMARARDIGVIADDAPIINYVVLPSDLSGVKERFRAVVSCHVIEHQPDIIGHLQQVGQLLAPGGRYFLIVPDRRFCADHYLANSTLDEMIAAHSEGRVTHTLRSLIQHRVLTVHNESRRHWEGDHGRRFDDFSIRLKDALVEFAAGDFVDLHAWHFDPDSFRDVVTDLADLEQVPFHVDVVYPTRRGDLEFYAVLSASAADDPSISR